MGHLLKEKDGILSFEIVLRLALIMKRETRSFVSHFIANMTGDYRFMDFFLSSTFVFI
jgi:hypothetical protein